VQLAEMNKVGWMACRWMFVRLLACLLETKLPEFWWQPETSFFFFPPSVLWEGVFVSLSNLKNEPTNPVYAIKG